MTTLTDTQVITASGGLVELGYKATISGSHSITQTGASRYSLMSSPLSVVCDGSPVLVEVFLAGARPDLGAGNRQLYVGLYIDGVEVFTQFGLFITPAAGDVYRPSPISYRYTPTAGAHTFEVRASVDAGAGYIEGGSATRPPSYIRVSKIVQATQWPAATTGTIICTSSTRPASPFEGQTIYESDTDFTYTYNGSTWTLTGTLGSGFVTASSTTAQGPASTLTYIHATITVTPGVWIVNSAMSVFNATTSDGTAVGIYNRTTSAVVSGSMGVPRETSTSSSGYAALHSAPTKIVVSSNTDLCPYATRNGASNLQTTNWTGLHSQGVPNGLITAQRLYGG